MHIAHRKEKLLSVEDVARHCGLKRRQIANLARDGKIDGARRSADGYHFEYPDTEKLRTWIAWKRQAIRRRQAPVKNPRNDGVPSPHAVAVHFMFWRREIGESWKTMDLATLLQLSDLLRPVAAFYEEVCDLADDRIGAEEIPH